MDLTQRRPTSTVSISTWVERSRRLLTFGAACHQDFELAWVIEGVVHYRIGAKEITVTPGSAILLPAGHEHETRIAPAARACSLHLSADLVAGVAEVLGPAFQHRELEAGLVPAPEGVLVVAGLLVEECAETAGPGNALAADGLAEALAVRVLRGAPHRARRAACRDGRILRTLQLIEASHGADLDVEALAREAGMSRYHFSRIFREMTGTSPYQHLLDVRLARAAELLRGGHASVTEAALSAGFIDFGRFAAHFQRRFGCLPSQMRVRPLVQAGPSRSREAAPCE